MLRTQFHVFRYLSLHRRSATCFSADCTSSPASCVKTNSFLTNRPTSTSPALCSASSIRQLHSFKSIEDDSPLRAVSGPPKSSSSLQQSVDIPSEASIVIVGGGVIGCSIAYHLAKAGAKDVYLLEKSQLTHGCTWHAAGLLGQLRGTKNLTRMLQYSAECFGKLQQETGLDPEWKPVGSIRVASSMERWKEIKRSSSQAAGFGFGMHLISPSEAKRLCPVLETNDLFGAAWIPTDGHVEPTSLTNAFARGARDGGVKILQGVEVVGKGDKHSDGNIFSRPRIDELHVKSKHSSDPLKVHRIKVGKVINCAGLWARKLGQLLGTNIPTINVQHQYLVTEKLSGTDELPKSLPSFRDPDALLYYKPEMGGLVIGGWEPNTIAVDVPDNFGPELYEGDMDRFEQHAIQAARRTPAVQQVGIKRLVNGPIPISADGEPILGLCSEYNNVFVAAGFTAGIGASGGAGKFVAEWVMHGEPSIDLFPLDIRRFSTTIHSSKSWLEMRGIESYGKYYKMHYPNQEPHTGRQLRLSGAYSVMQQNGAVFGTKFGWERPLFYMRDENGTALPSSTSTPLFNRLQNHPIFRDWKMVEEEHNAARNGCVLIDQSSFAKLEVTGRDASKFIQRLTNNDLGGAVGSVVYTQMLNERGGIEADVTIARTGEFEYYLITGSGFGTRDFGWVRSNVPSSSDISLTDVTSQYAVINVAGPNSRKLLSSLGVEEDISNEAFPFMTWRTIHFSNGISARALRVTFVGELGYELHIRADQMATLYSQLASTAEKHPDLGVRHAGYRVLETLRLEKGYRVWGSDLNPQTNPLEAGLGFCCKFDKPGGFIGDEALKKLKASGGPTRKLVCFTVDDANSLSNQALGFSDKHDAELGIQPSDPLLLYGNEAVSYNGRVVGFSSSAGFGYSVGKHIVYAYLPRELADIDVSKGGSHTFELNAYGTQVSLTKHKLNVALVDPKREKILS